MDAKEFERELMADFSASKGGVMATFGYSEMRDWAEQSDDPRVRSMWQRLSNCRSTIAKWCEAMEYAELRSKNLAAENAALRAEVERMQERFDAVRDAAHAEAKRAFPAAVVESHFGGELHADDLCSMLANEIERLREERRWIPVEERPPESHTDVLVFDDDYAFGYYDAEEEGWRRIDHKFIDPAYWMPLPAPPAKEE